MLQDKFFFSFKNFPGCLEVTTSDPRVLAPLSLSYQLTISAGDRWHPSFIRAHIQKRSWDTTKIIWLLRKTESIFIQARSPRGHSAFNHALCIQCARPSRLGETSTDTTACALSTACGHLAASPGTSPHARCSDRHWSLWKTL